MNSKTEGMKIRRLLKDDFPLHRIQHNGNQRISSHFLSIIFTRTYRTVFRQQERKSESQTPFVRRETKFNYKRVNSPLQIVYGILPPSQSV